jgi:AbrB family looped-hinge helix DNA binding protein
MKSLNCLVKIDSNGKVQIPKKAREYLELDKGDLAQITITKVGEAHGTGNSL